MGTSVRWTAMGPLLVFGLLAACDKTPPCPDGGDCQPPPDAGVPDAGPLATCGGFLATPCDAGFFCDLPEGSCASPDLQGGCQPIPPSCAPDNTPVCGCDGRTYANDCERIRAEIALDHKRGC